MTHSVINPQANRSKSTGEQADPFLAAGIVEERPTGLIVRGARMLATLAPFADEIVVFPSTSLRPAGPHIERYSYAFAIPCDTPGLPFIARESIDTGQDHVDRPLGSRFDELDAIVVFDDVDVPWDRVFLKGDPERCNQVYGVTDAVVHMMHQVAIKNVAKSEFVLGLADCMVDLIQIDRFQHVQEKLAEIIVTLETMRACLRAAEADASLNAWGVMTPARMPLDIARNLFPGLYPQMVEILQLLGASGLMITPTARDFARDIGGDVEKYLRAARGDARADRRRPTSLGCRLLLVWRPPGTLRALLLRRLRADGRRALHRLRHVAQHRADSRFPAVQRRTRCRRSSFVTSGATSRRLRGISAGGQGPAQHSTTSAEPRR